MANQQNNTNTTNRLASSAEGQQQPYNDNVNVNVRGVAATGTPIISKLTPPSTAQLNFARGSSVSPPGLNRGPSGRGKSPPGGRGSPSSGRGSSSFATSPGAGQITQFGGRNFTPLSVEITVGGRGSGAAGGSMIPGSSSGSPPRAKRKAEITAPEGVSPVCSVCKRSNFSSWKALFGHMRCHPERQWRGCFPPPGFEEAQRALQQGERLGALRGFDLNEASDPEEENESGGSGGFDLNMLPPDEDKDGGGGSGGAAKTG
ncbi:CCR4-NOT transcription complex subunit 3 [Prunus yedoensis var. nudiflora]|uniref:CCR4-NOT transcription complex subunit 3 n=1 Tax=Prunus yedoensis var. nudiflora TaxID=2094558 RepID=A0A314YH53_PRUYE|nr:CCR4-NOT transcription complex subunit 3 [Prunus yedoensis var. nudiflora]